MKKLLITLLSTLALAMMFTGCGGSAGSAQGAPGASDATEEVASTTVSENEVSKTTPKTPYNLSSVVGTPPGLPGQ